MSKINIDGKDHLIADLSDGAKGCLTSMQFIDNEIAELNKKIAVYQTARKAYGSSLKDEIKKGE